jgi:hypothetical protein
MGCKDRASPVTPLAYNPYLCAPVSERLLSDPSGRSLRLFVVQPDRSFKCCKASERMWPLSHRSSLDLRYDRMIISDQQSAQIGPRFVIAARDSTSRLRFSSKASKRVGLPICIKVPHKPGERRCAVTRSNFDLSVSNMYEVTYLLPRQYAATPPSQY